MVERLIRYKVYIDRSRGYASYIQFILILLVFFEAYKTTNFGVWFYSKWWTLPVFIILVFVMMIAWGYIDMKYIRPKEYSELNKTNRELMEVLKLTKEIHGKL